MQEEIKVIVDDFIFENPFLIDYMDENPYRFGTFHSKVFVKREYDLLQSVWLAFASRKNKYDLTFKGIEQELNIKVKLSGYLTRAKNNIGIKTLQNFKIYIQKYLKNEILTFHDINKIRIYKEAINQINEYIVDRKLKLSLPVLSSSYGYDSELWEDPQVKAYHIISLLVRDLGFDLVDFNPFDPQIFERGPTSSGNNFQRHHISIVEKMLLTIKRLILTDNRNHNTLNQFSRNQAGINEQQSLIDGMRELIRMKGTVSEKDIIQVFKGKFFGGKLISDRWVKDNKINFNIFLREFNLRKKMLEAGDIEGLIKRISVPAYKRFYQRATEIINAYLLIDGEVDQSRISRLFSSNDVNFLKKYFKI